MEMTVILRVAMTVEMHMSLSVMIMLMEVPPFTNQLHPQQTAEHHQHEPHDPFGGDGKRFGNGYSKHEHDRADQ
jgi:hypothetical protein